MTRYCFSICFMPDHADSNILVSRCLSILHGFTLNNKLGGNIGVSFPCWTDNEIGRAIAFVADDRDQLVGLSAQEYFSTMKKNDMFDISSVIALPDDLNEVRFIRNHSINKMYAKRRIRRMERTIRRAKERGIEHTPVKAKESIIAPFHSIRIFSQSKNCELTFNLQKEDSERSMLNDFNSYGLATNKKFRGSVPEISLNLF